jgi:hypothetical protein
MPLTIKSCGVTIAAVNRMASLHCILIMKLIVNKTYKKPKKKPKKPIKKPKTNLKNLKKT